LSRAVVVLTVGAMSCVSLAQTGAIIAPAITPIPNTIKTASSISASDVTVINEFVSNVATSLASTDPVVQSRARDVLVAAARVDGSASKASADYLWEYAAAVDKAVFPLVRNPSMRVRLNAAIVAAHVTADAPSQSSRLQRSVEAMLRHETDPAVLLWALKAVQPIVGQSLLSPKTQFPNANPLVNAIVEKCATVSTGPIIEEAYEAVTLNWQARGKQIVPPIYQTVIPAVQSMMRTRIDQYKKGVPDEPILDANYGLRFLTDATVLPLETREQKLQTVQLLHDLTAVAATRAASATSRPGKEELILLLQRASGFLQVVADHEKAPPATVAAMKGLAQLQASTSPQVILDASRTALAALRSIPSLSNLAPAPVASTTTSLSAP